MLTSIGQRPASFLLALRLALLGLCLARFSPSAHAEPRKVTIEPQGYREAIGAGIEEFDFNHFTEAREHFARAHALFPNARTLRGLGLCDFELRRYVAAVGYLREALASQVKPLGGELRKDTEAILLRARGYVGKLRVQVQPDAAALTIDGLLLEPDAEGGVLLEVGDHVLEARATGHVTERRELQVRGGQDERLLLKLDAIELQQVEVVAARAPAPAAAPSADRKPVYKQWWLWTVVGVAVAGAAAGTAVALTSDSRTVYEPTSTANTPMGVSLQPLGSR